jgi:hypothetical protein
MVTIGAAAREAPMSSSFGSTTAGSAGGAGRRRRAGERGVRTMRRRSSNGRALNSSIHAWSPCSSVTSIPSAAVALNNLATPKFARIAHGGD